MSHNSHREKPGILITGVCKGDLDTQRCWHLVRSRGEYQIKLIFNSEWNPIFCAWSIFLHFKFRVKISVYPAKTYPSSHSWSQRFVTLFEVFHCSTFPAAENLAHFRLAKHKQFIRTSTAQEFKENALMMQILKALWVENSQSASQPWLLVTS